MIGNKFLEVVDIEFMIIIFVLIESGLMFIILLDRVFCVGLIIFTIFTEFVGIYILFFFVILVNFLIFDFICFLMFGKKFLNIFIYCEMMFIFIRLGLLILFFFFG